MSQLACFFIETALCALVVMGLRRTCPPHVEGRAGVALAMVCLALAVVGLGCIVAAALAGPAVRWFTGPVRGWLSAAVPLVAGAALAAALAPVDKPGAVRFRHWTVLAVRAYIGLSFIGFEVGKIAHDAEMRTFFLTSGLPLVLMYAVMAVETLAAIALLLGRARLPAAALLAVVMCAAIGTHMHNGDPSEDALDAVRMLTLCLAVVAATALRSEEIPAPVQAGRAHPG